MQQEADAHVAISVAVHLSCGNLENATQPYGRSPLHLITLDIDRSQSNIT